MKTEKEDQLKDLWVQFLSNPNTRFRTPDFKEFHFPETMEKKSAFQEKPSDILCEDSLYRASSISKDASETSNNLVSKTKKTIVQKTYTHICDGETIPTKIRWLKKGTTKVNSKENVVIMYVPNRKANFLDISPKTAENSLSTPRTLKDRLLGKKRERVDAIHKLSCSKCCKYLYPFDNIRSCSVLFGQKYNDNTLDAESKAKKEEEEEEEEEEKENNEEEEKQQQEKEKTLRRMQDTHLQNKLNFHRVKVCKHRVKSLHNGKIDWTAFFGFSFEWQHDSPLIVVQNLKFLARSNLYNLENPEQHNFYAQCLLTVFTSFFQKIYTHRKKKTFAVLIKVSKKSLHNSYTCYRLISILLTLKFKFQRFSECEFNQDVDADSNQYKRHGASRFIYFIRLFH